MENVAKKIDAQVDLSEQEVDEVQQEHEKQEEKS
jgi:hypothetical protein